MAPRPPPPPPPPTFAILWDCRREPKLCVSIRQSILSQLRFSQSRWWKLSKVIILAEISYDQIYFLEIYKILKLYKYYTGQIVIFFRFSNFHEDFSFYNIIAILLHVTVARNSIFFILYRIRGRPYHIVSFYLLNLIYSLSFHDSIKNWTDNGGEGKGKRSSLYVFSIFGIRLPDVMDIECLNRTRKTSKLHI